MDNKRKCPRLPLDVEVNFSQKAIARSKDISEGGICLITEEELEKDKIYTLVFNLPTGKPIKCFGKIAWSKQATEHLFEQGALFWEIDSSDKKKIQDYFEQQSG